MTCGGSTDPGRAARAARRAAIRRAHPDLGGSATQLAAVITSRSGDRGSVGGARGTPVEVRVTVTGRGAVVRRRVGVTLRRVRAHLPGGPTYYTL